MWLVPSKNKTFKQTQNVMKEQREQEEAAGKKKTFNK